MGSHGPFYLVVECDSPIASKDVHIAAADGPGIKFAGAGPGSMAHVAQLTLDNNLRVTTRYIQSKGGGDIATEINVGRADATMWIADFGTRFGWRALAILSDKRPEEHPDSPTMAELGPEVFQKIYMGAFASSGQICVAGHEAALRSSESVR